jgi:hypothetical protein
VSKATEIRERLDILEAERLIITVELRTELLKAARDLLPEAIRQAKPQPAGSAGHGKKRTPARAGSPALLRLIARLAMRSVQPEKRK